MKHFRPILVIMSMVMLLPAIAHANIGPAIVIQYGIHLMFLTWMIGIGEAILLCVLFRTWKVRIFISMIAANFVSALLGVRFINSEYVTRIMGDVTIENLVPFFWTMVYVTFVLTMIIEFPFFVYALYGRKWLVPKAVVATLLAHCIGYILLFNFYDGEENMTMVTALEIVPATTFEIGEDYDLYYISADGKHVFRSDLTGKGEEIIATLDLDGSPDHLCACPRVILENSKRDHWDSQRVCWECGFDLFVLMAVENGYEKVLLLEDFTSRPAVFLLKDEYNEWCDGYHKLEFYSFRSFGDEEEWKYEMKINDFYQEGISGGKLQKEPRLEAGSSKHEKGSDFNYRVTTPFAIWPVSNATHIAGDYAVFKLGKDQICILDPEKKRIALIARGFGPVVAKPPLDNVEPLPAPPEETPPESVPTNEPTPKEIPQDSV